MVVSFLEMQRRLIQTKVHHNFFHFVSKETTDKPSKVAVAENYSSSVYVIDTTCFAECFLFYLITRIHCFLQKFVVTKRFFQLPYCSFLWNLPQRASVLKEFRILPCLHNISAVLITKLSPLILCLRFYTLLFCDCSTIFFLNEFSLKNWKPLWKHVFCTIEFLFY